MRTLLLGPLLALLWASACAPEEADATPCPSAEPSEALERRSLEGCDSLVDPGTLPLPPLPPECPASSEPVPSLCAASESAPSATVWSQAELEAYRDCKRVDGDLTITGTVCSLSPLSQLEEVTGSLVLGGGEEETSAASFTDLTGLGALRRVGRDLWITNLPLLASLDGLSALEEISFGLQLSRLDSLVHLEGPSSLSVVGTDVTVGFLPALRVVSGFEGLTTLRDDVSGQRGRLTVFHNPDLVCVAGFSSLQDVGHVELSGPSLIAAPGLSSALVAAEPELLFVDAVAFDFQTLPAMTALDGLTLIRPGALEDLRAFTGIERLGSLRLHGPELRSLEGLQSLTELDALDLSELPGLDDVTALAGLSRIGELRLSETLPFDLACALPSLEEVTDLSLRRTSFKEVRLPPLLQRIEGTLSYTENPSLLELAPPPPSLTINDAFVAANEPITNDDVEAWLADVTVTGVAKVGANAGAAPASPCPWTDDGVCDVGWLCETDSESDCPFVE